MKDKVWFFGAGQSGRPVELRSTTTYTNISFVPQTARKRYEGKLTISPFQNHTLTGSYIRIDTEQEELRVQLALPFYAGQPLQPAAPPGPVVGNYNGVLSDNVLRRGAVLEAEVHVRELGGRLNDLIQGTVLMTSRSAGTTTPPICCARARPRNATTRTSSSRGRTSSPRSRSARTTSSSDSTTSLARASRTTGSPDPATSSTGPARSSRTTTSSRSSTRLRTSASDPIPNRHSGATRDHDSVFLNDTWRLNNNLSFNIGVRWDKNHAKDAAASSRPTTAPSARASPPTTTRRATASSASTASYATLRGRDPGDGRPGAADGFGRRRAYYYATGGPEINTTRRGRSSRRAPGRRTRSSPGSASTVPNQFPTIHAARPRRRRFPASTRSSTAAGVSPRRARVRPSAVSGSLGAKALPRGRRPPRVQGLLRPQARPLDGPRDGLPWATRIDLAYIEISNDYRREVHGPPHVQFAYRPDEQAQPRRQLDLVSPHRQRRRRDVGLRSVQLTDHSYPEYFRGAGRTRRATSAPTSATASCSTGPSTCPFRRTWAR